jgi:hypothetical protein
MKANDTTLGQGESPSTAQTTDWERLGRVLLAEAIEYRGDVLRERWMEIARKARTGEPVTRRDWRRLTEDMEQFVYLVEELEEATREGADRE